MKYIVGVDGGGTKTKAVAAESTGRIVCATEVGAGNFMKVGENGIKKICTAIISIFSDNSRLKLDNVSCCVLGLAGAGRKGDQDRAKKAIASLQFSGEVMVKSDAYIGLIGAFEGRPGIIIISGTGSICFGLDDSGNLFRSGGWGYMLGDEGSGHYIGHKAVLAALKEYDGRGKPTILRQEIEKQLNVAKIDEIIPRIYSEQSLGKEEIAELAPLVFACAESGDAVSEMIISDACMELAEMVRAVAVQMKKMGEPLEIAYTGSVFRQKKKLLPKIIENLSSGFASVDIHEPSLEPALGAIIFGMQQLNIPVTPEVLRNLKSPYEMV